MYVCIYLLNCRGLGTCKSGGIRYAAKCQGLVPLARTVCLLYLRGLILKWFECYWGSGTWHDAGCTVWCPCQGLLPWTILLVHCVSFYLPQPPLIPSLWLPISHPPHLSLYWNVLCNYLLFCVTLYHLLQFCLCGNKLFVFVFVFVCLPNSYWERTSKG